MGQTGPKQGLLAAVLLLPLRVQAPLCGEEEEVGAGEGVQAGEAQAAEGWVMGGMVMMGAEAERRQWRRM